MGLYFIEWKVSSRPPRGAVGVSFVPQYPSSCSGLCSSGLDGLDRLQSDPSWMCEELLLCWPWNTACRCSQGQGT